MDDNLLSDRIENFELKFQDDTYKLLKAKSARLILDEKRKFITLFIHQLKDELYGTEMFGKTSIQDYFKC